MEASELYCDRLSKESAVWRDVREGVKGNVGAEVGGVRDARQNRVSPDNHSQIPHLLHINTLVPDTLWDPLLHLVHSCEVKFQ